VPPYLSRAARTLSQQELLNRTVAALAAADVPYMVTGSVASTYYGVPRATHDIDFVVQLAPAHLEALSAAFPAPAFHFDIDAAQEAVRSSQMFNIIDVQGGDKLDMWMLTSSPFDRSRFSRRREVTLGGVRIFLPAPEDVVLAKLAWAKLAGGSEKQIGDAAGVFEVQAGTLDMRYLHEWVTQLDLGPYWEQLQRKLGR
jgi:hypothetical protein